MTQLADKDVLAPGDHYPRALELVALDETGGMARTGLDTRFRDASEIGGWLFAIDRKLCGFRKAEADASNDRIRAALAYVREHYT